MNSVSNPNDSGMSVSERIKYRVKQSGKGFFANDSIAEFIEPGELDALIEEIATKYQSVLRSMVIDVDNDHNTKETAKRVAKMFVNELYSGRFNPLPEVTSFPNEKRLDQLYIVGPITVKSTCSHHMVPIIGKAFVGILPGDTLCGLSKFSRVVDHVMRRPQIQEEATMQIADKIMEIANPKGVAVIIKANHMCMQLRGVEEPNSFHTTSEMRGSFLEHAALKQEFLSLISKEL